MGVCTESWFTFYLPVSTSRPYWMTLPENGHISGRKEYFYSVLNVPKSASQHEIRERHRALSVIFHPDKQLDERTKDTASKKFLDIQKAYEILSDPFLREVYDILGEEGLKTNWSPDIRSKPTREIRQILKHAKRSIRQREIENIVRPRGELTCGINATSLFRHPSQRTERTRVQNILERINQVHVSTCALRHSVKKDFGRKTKIFLTSRISREKSINATGNGAGNILGTIAHQFSPRIEFEATAALLRPQLLNLKTTYRDDETSFFIQTYYSPVLIPLFPPPITASLSRRFFRDSLTEGTIILNTGPQTQLTFNVVSPKPFDFTSDRGPKKLVTNRAGSISGFGVGVRYWSYGATLAGLLSCLRAEWGVTFTELALQVKLGLELGLLGLGILLTGAWDGESAGVAASVGLNAEGVSMKLTLSYLEQRLTVPIVLSQDYNAVLALCTAVIPSTAFVLGYHFVLKPRRLAQRVDFFRASRRALDDDMSATKRDIEDTRSLLKDLAKKHTQTESAKEGLVILEAFYGPSEAGDEAKDLMVDVTIAVQALVHNSQVYISGHRPKSGIQGFYDPAPSLAKSLRVRYEFRGHMHYAEIPDYIPVVLPLEDHIVS